MKRATKLIIIFIFAYLTTMLLCIDVNLTEVNFEATNMFIQLNQILNSFDIIDVIIGIIIFCFYYQIFFDGQKLTRKNIVIGIISFVLSTLIVIGKNLQIKNGFPNISNIIMLFETVTMFSGAYLAFYSILKKTLSLGIFIRD